MLANPFGPHYHRFPVSQPTGPRDQTSSTPWSNKNVTAVVGFLDVLKLLRPGRRVAGAGGEGLDFVVQLLQKREPGNGGRMLQHLMLKLNCICNGRFSRPAETDPYVFVCICYNNILIVE